MRGDVRNAIRQWRQSPGVVAMALLSLTLGMGCTLALFSLVDALVRKRCPCAS